MFKSQKLEIAPNIWVHVDPLHKNDTLWQVLLRAVTKCHFVYLQILLIAVLLIVSINCPNNISQIKLINYRKTFHSSYDLLLNIYNLSISFFPAPLPLYFVLTVLNLYLTIHSTALTDAAFSR